MTFKTGDLGVAERDEVMSRTYRQHNPERGITLQVTEAGLRLFRDTGL